MKEIAPSYTEKTETAKIDYLDLSYQTVEDEIPLGLQGFWIKEIEKTEDHETIYNRILEAIQKIRRNNSAEISDDDYIINFAAEIPTEVEKRKAQILQDIKQIVRNQPEIIGDGNTAVVYIKRLENNKKSKYCIKVINNTNAPDYKNNNDIKEEFRLLEKVCKIEVDGVRASQPYAYVQNKGVHVLVMENLDAFTLSSVFEGINKLPKDFDPVAFFSSLEKYIRELHKRNIHHRDLHSGNIMIDRKTLKPLVIDFGKSKVILGSENPYLELNDRGVPSNFFMNDLIKIWEHKKTMFDHLNKKKGGAKQ